MSDITVKSFDGKMVRIPEEKREEYLRNQKMIEMYLEQGKTKEEIKEIMKNGWEHKTKNNRIK